MARQKTAAKQANDVPPTAALAGVYAAMLEAARYSGAGVRTAGRRTGTGARRLAATYGVRTVDAFQALRGQPPRTPIRGRRAMVAKATVVAGTSGALAALGIRRLLATRMANGRHTGTQERAVHEAGMTTVPAGAEPNGGTTDP
jgi:hypothetical protein